MKESPAQKGAERLWDGLGEGLDINPISMRICNRELSCSGFTGKSIFDTIPYYRCLEEIALRQHGSGAYGDGKEAEGERYG